MTAQQLLEPADDRSSAELTAEGALDGEDVLPGFRCPLRELFPAS
ncbi:MAG TPA: hypothetical protein VG370_27400 [Chloroflexota bacterium]|nr:hypothetical protein [Chloroflexota bacterium]